MDDESVENPMNHPAEQPAGCDDAPKFGRLLIVLLCVGDKSTQGADIDEAKALAKEVE